MTKLIFSLMGVLISQAAIAAATFNAQEVMQRNRSVQNIKDLTSDAVLVTGEKSKTFHWWRKLNSDGQHFNTLIRFDSPAEVRGQGVLFLEYAKGENDVLIYLPTFKKIRRVETQQQSASFMASEFSYSDLSNPNLADFAYKAMDTVVCTSAGVKCYVVQCTSANDKVKERTGYSHKTLWIRTDNAVVEKAEFFGVDGELVKKETVGHIQKLPGDKWMPLEISFTNAKTGKISSIQFSHVKVNGGIDDSIFTEQNLSRVK